MKYMLLPLFALLGLTSCKTTPKETAKKDYQIIYDEGLYVEKFDSTNTNDNRYTANNETYLAGNTLIYDYYYEDREGNKFKFEEEKGASELDYRERVNAWYFVPIDSLNERTINKIELKVRKGLSPMNRNNPDYCQTVISYDYPQVNGERKFNSFTGVIENEKNIWAHPPRDRFFRILELNPFPFIQTPYEIGHTWEWSLGIGSFWGDERWKTWEGSIENLYIYEIVDKKKVDLAIGRLDCFLIQSKAKSAIGQTELLSYFNEEMGFVKLEYLNIDSTKTVLELTAFEGKEQKD